jgi:hypothetical protein
MIHLCIQDATFTPYMCICRGWVDHLLLCQAHLFASKFLMTIRGLRSNKLEGSLSPDMCQLTGLWYLWVHCLPSSTISVVISYALCYVHIVTFIYLSDVKNNSLTGTIPETIGNCTSFQVLYVYTFYSFWTSLSKFWSYNITELLVF